MGKKQQQKQTGNKYLFTFSIDTCYHTVDETDQTLGCFRFEQVTFFIILKCFDKAGHKIHIITEKMIRNNALSVGCVLQNFAVCTSAMLKKNCKDFHSALILIGMLNICKNQSKTNLIDRPVCHLLNFQTITLFVYMHVMFLAPQES